jgi:hypothetical protein
MYQLSRDPCLGRQVGRSSLLQEALLAAAKTRLSRRAYYGNTEARTLKIPLTEEQFEIAAQAITLEQGLVVSGRQEKEKRTTYLYDASGIALVDLSPPGRSSVEERRPGPGQTSLGTD